MNQNFLQNLKERGLVEQFSHPEKVEQVINQEKHIFYLGIDPTADSLHIGHLLPLILLRHLVKNGHKAICLVGDGTALIGDPSGKSEMRKMLDKSTIKKNAKLIKKQIEQLIPEIKTFAYNGDWLGKLNYLDFLRDFGPIFKVNEMIRAETYRARLNNNESLTFLEFNYQLLQAYDFLHLFQKYNCTVQIGGGDQWSNMLAGIDLIRRKHDRESYVVTVPLLVNSAGKKMGKTEKGALWLDKEKTSPYEFYQYWINVDDTDVKKLLKIFTEINLEEIESIDMLSYEGIRKAKEILAFEITKFIHGEKEALLAKETSEKLFSGDSSDLGDDVVPTVEIKSSELKEISNITDLLTKLNLIPSKTQARQLLDAGGIYINKEKINQEYNIASLKKQETFVVRVGKKKYSKIKIV